MKVKERRGDGLKWFVLFALLALGIYANSHFSTVPLAVRTAVGLLVAFVSILIVGQTAKGQIAWGFLKGARTELRKVIWPTRRETAQMTFLVAAMVVVVALLLWGLDAFFFWLVRFFSV